jgi:integrase
MARRKVDARQRRQRGSGGVWQDKKTGQWWCGYEDEEGDYRRHRATSREAAETFLAEIARKKLARIRIAGGARSVNDFFNDWFNTAILPRLHIGELKPKTVEHYQQMIELYILPALGRFRLDALTVPDVLQFKNMLQEHVSAQTTRLAFRVLRDALSDAVEWRYIEQNPALSVRPPRVVYAEPEPLTTAESRALLRAVDTHRLATLFHMALTLGLRLGELLGLRWIDVEMERATLKVVQQIQPDGGKTRVVTPKSPAGIRTLPIPPHLLARLAAHWRNQQEERALRGTEWKEHGYVFPSERGTPKGPRNLERDFYRFRVAAGLSDEINFHLLRHTLGTWLDEAGATDTVKQAILGHGKKNVTQRYTHARLSAMRRALEDVEQILWGTGEASEKEA